FVFSPLKPGRSSASNRANCHSLAPADEKAPQRTDPHDSSPENDDPRPLRKVTGMAF
ncbi:hypothetical protein N8T08_003219, partial [Aspergillus melleus]